MSNQELGPKLLESHGEGGERLIAAHAEKSSQLKAERERKSMEASGDNSAAVERMRQTAELAAIKTEELSRAEKVQEPATPHPFIAPQQIKKTAHSRALTRAQKRENFAERSFSKVVHNEVVERASEAVGKTVARPSGMVGGALASLVGTSLLLWVTRHFGYEYNYLMVIIFFGAGMAIGLSIEALYKMKKTG